VIIGLLRQGWIRVSYIVRSASYVITTWGADKRINQWAEALVHADIIDLKVSLSL
jgi:hypothetical protein